MSKLVSSGQGSSTSSSSTNAAPLRGASSAYSSTFKPRPPPSAPLDPHISLRGNPTSCHFCATLNKNLYMCPRCGVAYCGVRCYKSEAHSKCSEDFYKSCVKEELEGRLAETKEGQRKPETFEESMERYLRGEAETMPGTADIEEGEKIGGDSDDEGEGPQEDYLERVLEETVKGYVDDKDADIERRLTCLGVGSEVEQLMAVLDADERAAFAALAEKVYREENGLGNSCFRKK